MKIGCFEGVDAHENPVGGAQTEVGLVAVLKVPCESDAAGGQGLFRRAQGQRLQFLQAQRFETRCRCSEEFGCPSDDLPPEAFFKCR